MNNPELGSGASTIYHDVIDALKAAQSNHDLFCTIAAYYPDSGITLEQHEEVTTSIINYAAETLAKCRVIATSDTVSGLIVGAGIRDTQILVMLRQPQSDEIIPVDVNKISQISPLTAYQVPLFYPQYPTYSGTLDT